MKKHRRQPWRLAFKKRTKINKRFLEECDHLPNKVTGIKTISSWLKWDVWDLPYHNRYNTERSWKKFRRTQYK